MRTLEEIGGALLAMAITLTLGLLVMVLQVHIIYDIAEMYNLFVVTIIPVEAMYGLLFVIGMIRARTTKNKKEQTSSEAWGEAIKNIAQMCLVYLLGWLLAGLFHMVVF